VQRFTRCVLPTLVLVFTAAPLMAQSELNGAWQAVDVRGHNPEDGDWKTDSIQPSLYLFHNGHYSMMYITGNESRPLLPDGYTRETLTNEQLRSTLIPFVANSGTYEIDGATLSTKPIVALIPNFMEGGSAAYTYRIEGDRLILTASGERWETIVTLERLE